MSERQGQGDPPPNEPTREESEISPEQEELEVTETYDPERPKGRFLVACATAFAVGLGAVIAAFFVGDDDTFKGFLLALGGVLMVSGFFLAMGSRGLHIGASQEGGLDVSTKMATPYKRTKRIRRRVRALDIKGFPKVGVKPPAEGHMPPKQSKLSKKTRSG